MFVCQDLQVKWYDSHFHAYAIEQVQSVRVVEHSKLKYFKPLSMRHAFVLTLIMLCFLRLAYQLFPVCKLLSVYISTVIMLCFLRLVGESTFSSLLVVDNVYIHFDYIVFP